ncbi:MAG: MoaD/ThiS family protein [Acidothermus sp.]|nr:MoaD/ThiS family protein [Acidothermus sp.]MCL6537470.1 MoaD/ThiS family protein [Acidothermus sp.]
MGTTCTLRYWAAARDAAGISEEPCEAETLADALAIARRHGPRLAAVLNACSFLIDGCPAGGRDPSAVPLHPGAVIDVLPPFAGGSL